MRTISRLASGFLVAIAIAAGIALCGHLGTARTAFAGGSFFFSPFLPLQVSTVPSNGDTTPYGLAFVPYGFPYGGSISPGELLVSNFNNTTTAGQGTTIITVNPETGATGLFFQGSSPIGFTNALTIARAGLVFGGSLPTSIGPPLTPLSGPLDVFNQNGNLLTSLGASDLVAGPWGMALNDLGTTAQLFVSNIFNPSDTSVFSGNITRLDVSLTSSGITVLDKYTIASGYTSATDATGTVVGPAGLAYDSYHDILYVASEGDDAIYKLTGAGSATSDLGTGTVVYNDETVLHGPLGLIFAPNGDLITANADPSHFLPSPTDPSEIIEITRGGSFVREFSIDSAPGSAFAVDFNRNVPFGQFVYVDDTLSNATIWNLPGLAF